MTADAFRDRLMTAQIRRFGTADLPASVQVKIANHAATTGLSEKLAFAELITLHGSLDRLKGYCKDEHKTAVKRAKQDLKFEEKLASLQPFTDTPGSIYKRTNVVPGGGTGTGGKKR